MRRGCLLLALLLFSSASHAAVFYPTFYTLKNGLQLVVVPNRLSPAVNHMIWYKVGSADEVAGKTGLAHYLEHLMFRGTKNSGPGEFSKTIAAQGGNDNAFTAYDYTAYYVNVAADRLPMVMQMEADRMQNLQIKPEIAAPELNVVLSERQERTDNDPFGTFNEKLRQILLPNHPYGVPVIGHKSEIEKLTVSDAEAFYRSHYAPNNAIVIVSGDVKPEEVKDLAEKMYGPVPKHELAPRPALPPTAQPSQDRFEMKDARIDQPQLQYNIVVPSYSTQKGREANAYEVLAEALESGEVGFLFRKLVKEMGLASGVSVRYDPDARGDTLFTIAASPRPDVKPGELEKALPAVLAELAKTGFDDKAVDDAKQRLQRAAVFVRDSLMMPGYAFGMAMTTGNTVGDVEEWPNRIKQVSKNDVNKALNELIANPKHVMGVLLPNPDVPKQELKPVSSPHGEMR